MKRIIYFLLLWMALIHSEVNIYQAYDYNDTHHIRTIMKQGVSLDTVILNSTLYVRTIENNGTKYNIFWLKNRSIAKKDIDINSIYAPFVIQNSSNSGFEIAKIKTLTKDREIIDRLIGIVDILQFRPHQQGIYRFRNTLGNIEVNQTVTKHNSYNIKYLTQYTKGQIRQDIKYNNSSVKIVPDTNSSIWLKVTAHEDISISVAKPKATMSDKRDFLLTKNIKPLPKNHWFLQLGYDISKWKFNRYQGENKLSLSDASKIFKQKENEMKAVVDDREKFNKWVLDNMDFLSHLDKLLETYSLEDKVSRVLFASLGYVDTTASSNILSKVFLNEDIDKKERFRSIMGLKNTSAPLDDDILDNLISYGLEQSSDDMLTKASGMLIGTMAKNRVHRVPEQYEKISSAISSAIETQDNKVVALDAAGNMQQYASDAVLESVESVLTSDITNELNRQKSAEALERIQRSNLSVSDFKRLFNQEKSTIVQSQLLKSSTVAQDFKSNTQYHSFLKTYANKKTNPKINRLATLEALTRAGFGKTDEEKQTIRAMMVGEQDRDISLFLRNLYRR